MPQTKFQSVVFTLMMVFFMVFSMTVYTLTLNMGGLTYYTFLLAIKEMWIEYVIVFVLIFFFISPTALKAAKNHVDPRKISPLIFTVTVQTFTVLMTVPIVTLIVTFIHNGFTVDWMTSWITTAAKCLPCAFFIQICYVGPMVRFLFRHIFAFQLSHRHQPSEAGA